MNILAKAIKFNELLTYSSIICELFVGDGCALILHGENGFQLIIAR
jgi:hypothetical protein